MNAVAQTRESKAQRDFLKHANFEPVFDGEGNIIDIRELRISTDRRAGMEAMRELFSTREPGDDVLGADGWTSKQRRILATPAPLTAHYLRHSQKWDAKTGLMRDAVLIQLPFEVVWTMFELLFEGQYSVKVVEIEYEDEEVVPVGNDHHGEQADDAPGRRFYARATVCISIHLPGAPMPREYHGVGVAYGQLSTDKTGNVYKINSERRTVDKGAIADAKREALASMGRVFRRAFEDGDEMIDHIESLLLAKIHEHNKPAIHRRGARPEAVPAPIRAVPAPAARPKQENQKQDAAENGHGEKEAPRRIAEKVSVTIPGAPERLVDREGFDGIFLDILFETCVTGSEAEALLRANEKTVADLIEDRSEIDEAITSLKEQPEDEIPDFATPEPTAIQAIDTEGKSGKAVLAEFKDLIEKAKSVSEIEGIIEANGAALRKLTAKQTGQLWDFRTRVQEKL